MEEHRVLIALSGVIVFGTAAQWISARLRLPSILLLLLAGFLAGPIMGLIQPNEMFGELLFPIVSLSVGIILFEGSLSLHFSQLREIGKTLGYLLTIGVAVTWFLAALGAYYILGFETFPSILLGAILTVTGPTVIGPILRQIRPIGAVGPVARWEGIVIDPVGAVLAVLVFEAHVHTGHGEGSGFWIVAQALGETVLYGTALGAIGAGILTAMLKRHLIPDHLESLVTLLFVVTAFTTSNILQEESGLVAVTVMGVLVANTKVTLKHIVEFKESLSLLLISGLFILLSARVGLDQFTQLGWSGPLFVLFMIIIVRPLAVFASTFATELTWQEKVLLSWLAPRGIVAAAVASVFALEMGEAGSGLVPATFLLIVGTVVIYGLTAFPLARWLGLATSDPQGILIVGAHKLARSIGHAIQQSGYPVLLVDTNHWNLRTARLEGLHVANQNVLRENVEEDLDLGGIGRLLAMTSNDEVNTLSAMHFAELFGRANIFQLVPWRSASKNESAAPHLRARYLFGEKVTYETLSDRLERGSVIKVTKLTQEYSYEKFKARYASSTLMFVSQNRRLTVVDEEHTTEPKAGQTIIAMVDPLLVMQPEQGNEESKEETKHE